MEGKGAGEEKGGVFNPSDTPGDFTHVICSAGTSGVAAACLADGEMGEKQCSPRPKEPLEESGCK